MSRPQDRPRPGVLFARGRTLLTPGTRASSDTPRHPACTQVHLPLMLNPLPLHPLEAETLYPWYGLPLLAPSGLAVTCLTPFSSSLSFHPVCDRDINDQIGRKSEARVQYPLCGGMHRGACRGERSPLLYTAVWPGTQSWFSLSQACISTAHEIKSLVTFSVPL